MSRFSAYLGENCNVQVAEVTITEAFRDFITYAAQSDSVYTKKVTLEKIRFTMDSI